MSKKHLETAAPQKGLVQDVHPINQPDGTYRFALNAVHISEQGEQGFLSIEKGNTACYEIPDGYYVIGSVPMINNKVILFLVSDDNEHSEIGIGDANCIYTTVINSDCLGFTKEEQIQGTFSIVNGCETMVYFKSPKILAINLTNVDQYLLAGYTQTTANADGEGWDCDLFKQFPGYDRPILTEVNVSNSGGNLPLGTYHIVTAYIDNEGNSPGWLDFTNPIPVVDESFSGTFKNIDGGFNSDIPTTSKSISFSYSNIDTSYSYLRIGLVASNDGVRTGYLITDLPITSSSVSGTIASIDIEEEIPLTELVISPVVYEEAETVTQINNRLVYANLKGKDVDHSAFQQAVNDIKVTWFADERGMKTMPSDNYKHSDEFVFNRGYMRDEVYALGIVFMFNDGYISPAYHIPGRPQDTGRGDYFVGNVLPANYEPNTHNRLVPTAGWDSTTYTVVASTSPASGEVYVGDVEHLGLTVGDTVERWEVFNTGISQTSTDHYSEGELAYWESTLDYPDTLDCNGVRVFPTGKIRHHKIPDTTLIDHCNTTSTFPIGLKVFNINVPAEYEDSVTGFMIVRVKRDDSNSTVVDKGLITNSLVKSSTTIFQPYPYNLNRDYGDIGAAEVDLNYHCIHTPKLKFYRESIGANYLKFEKIVRGVINYQISNLLIAPQRFVSSCELFDASNIPAESNTNRNIVEQIFMDTDTNGVSLGSYTFDNTEQQEVFAVGLDSPSIDLIGTGGLIVGDLQGTTESSVYFYYGGVKRLLPQQYGQVNTLSYIPTDNSFTLYGGAGDSKEIFGGDTFISEMIFRRTSRISAYVPCNHDEGLTLSDYADRHVITVVCESTINCGYRNEGDLDTEVYYPKTYPDDVERFAELELWTSDDTTDTDNRLLDVIPNYYEINPDFVQENDLRIYPSLPTTFDYCSTCFEEFKTRIIYSEVKTNEQNNDAFRVFLPNNYRDLTLNKGSIKNLFNQDDKLYAQLEGTTVMLPTNPQILATDTAEIYLGNAGFLQIEPVELKMSKEGYIGTNSQWGTCTSEFGTLFISYDKIFLIQEGLQEISMLGMRQFFQDNKLIFGDSFRELLLSLSSSSTLEFPYLDNPANPHGVGYTVCWDRTKSRFIIHKRDYKILFGLGSADEPIGYWGTKNTAITYIPGSIVYNTETGWFEQAGTPITNGGITIQPFSELEFSDTTLFENKSFTISFDPSANQWISFHSYLPNYVFNTYDKWYSFSTEHLGSIYKHNEGLFQNYYDAYQDHIIELVIPSNPQLSSVTRSIEFVSEAKKFNSTYNQWVDVPFSTFNRVWLYNTNQSSDILDVVVANNNPDPFISSTYIDGQVILFKAEKTWRFNRFYNTVIDTSIPFTTTNWTDIDSSYYIDKLPNPLAHGTVSMYERAKFRDKFVVLRLIRSRETDDTLGDLNLFTQYIIDNKKYSIR